MRWLLVFALLGGLQQPSPSAGKKRVELRIRPTLASAPGAVRATAIVERHGDNVALTLAAECPDYLRRSTFQLDGASAARKHTIVFEHLPVCTYDISATLHLRDGTTKVDVLTAKVVR